MTKYTMQTFVAGYSSPMGDDVEHHDTLAACKRSLVLAHWEAKRYGAGCEPRALVWIGHHDDVTDVYPDYRLTMGPRGGVQKETV